MLFFRVEFSKCLPPKFKTKDCPYILLSVYAIHYTTSVGYSLDRQRVSFTFSVLLTVIHDVKLKGTFAYIDNINVCGVNKEDHGKNPTHFLNAMKKYRPVVKGEVITIKELKLMGLRSFAD